MLTNVFGQRIAEEICLVKSGQKDLFCAQHDLWSELREASTPDQKIAFKSMLYDFVELLAQTTPELRQVLDGLSPRSKTFGQDKVPELGFVPYSTKDEEFARTVVAICQRLHPKDGTMVNVFRTDQPSVLTVELCLGEMKVEFRVDQRERGFRGTVALRFRDALASLSVAPDVIVLDKPAPLA